ncbi:MAG: insulinase family protein [Bdellovibrionaceae bacterium]|nr:insulinase family protein [Pseudobdellovibrionaceae bacterium]
MKAFDYQPEFNKTELKNGVRILTEHHPYTRSTFVGYFVDLGSRDESSSLLGASHFLEHILFKGTNSRSAYDIVSELESVGGEINAFTAKEYTCFHASTLREHKKISLNVLSDMMLNAKCSDEELSRERNVILQEIDMSKDVLEEFVFDSFFEQAFKGHPLSHPILGTAESLHKISREQLFEFYNQRYHGPHLIVSVAGDVDHNEVVKQLSDLESLRKPSVSKLIREPSMPSHFLYHEDRPAEQLHLLLSMPSCDFKSDLRFESYIVNAVLGGATTSRLYQKIRENKGLAYNVYSHLHSFTDSGVLITYVGTAAEKAEECLKLIKEELEDFKTKGITTKEVDYYKTQVMGQIMMGSDDVENRMNSIAINEMVFGEYRPVDQTLSQIEQVNTESVNRYIEKYLDFDQLGFIAMGNGSSKARSIAEKLFF